MEGETSPNEVLTPTFIGEQLVYVPLCVYYMGAEAIRRYIETPPEEVLE